MIRFVLGIVLVIGAGAHTDMTLFALQGAAGIGLLLWCLQDGVP